MTDICAVQGCSRSPVTRGMCHPHYVRWWRTGDPGPAEVQRRRARTGLVSHRKRDNQLWSKYGISFVDYTAMLAAQGGGCAICGRQDSGDSYRSFHVDHCHNSGTVRGILCSPCNKGLGCFGDDPDRLLAAATYLLKNTNVLKEVAL